MRSARRKVPDVGSLKAILKSAYHVPTPDISPIISTLQCQRVIQVAKKGGKITVLTA